MISSESKIRVRYAETDQMGYLHHSRYAQYYEVARTEMIREIYASYAQLEAEGIMLPLSELNCKFHAPVKYDEEITVKVFLKELPQVRIVFNYELYNENDKLVNSGSTTLVFVDAKTRRPCRAPENFMQVLRPYFEK